MAIDHTKINIVYFQNFVDKRIYFDTFFFL